LEVVECCRGEKGIREIRYKGFGVIVNMNGGREFQAGGGGMLCGELGNKGIRWKPLIMEKCK